MCFINNFLFVAIIFLSLLSLGNSLSCQQGTKINIDSTVVNNLEERPCPSNASFYACHRYDVTLTASGNTGTIVFSQCVMKEACPLINCSALQSFTTLPPNTEISDCCAACCDTDNCNNVESRLIDPKCNGSGLPAFTSWIFMAILSLGLFVTTELI